ncbi:MAG: thioredoxin family protein [Synergistaceae bacterium]|jgi:thioredoxin 1|nr:thioredoxin family protein [Synergistaceae bacterium]
MDILTGALLLILVLPTCARAAGLPTLKMLSTPTCPACKQMSHVLDDLKEKYAGRLEAEKLNAMEEREMVQKYKIRYVPYLLFVDAGGSVVKEKAGYMPLEEVLQTFRDAGVSVE